jgi:tRNA(Ile)-lysidine synthase
MEENLSLLPGKYIVAVSGGVDSVVLLDLLTKEPGLELTVAHVNHGIREDSANDANFVENLAKKYNLAFEKTELNLGTAASEELARQKRYEFLRKQAQKHQARAIITAHHQDDVIETAFINLIRGTGSRGLASLKSNWDVIRPLINLNKRQIYAYAKAKGLSWQEDSTNQDKTLLRNKVRHDLVAKMPETDRQKMLNIISNAHKINDQLEKELNSFMHRGLHKGRPVLSRTWFSYLPHTVATEVVRKLLIDTGATNIDKKTIEIVTVNLKTLPPGKTIQAPGVNITLTKRSARFKNHSKTDKKQV